MMYAKLMTRVPIRFYSSRLKDKQIHNFISIRKLDPNYQKLESQCNCYFENLKLADPITPITNITNGSSTPPRSTIPIYKRHVLLIDETSSDKQAHMRWKSKVEDNDGVYPYGILKKIKEKNVELMKEGNQECLPILTTVVELLNVQVDKKTEDSNKNTYKLLCLPEWKVLKFDESSIDEVCELVNKPDLDDTSVELLPFDTNELLLVCGHNQRDARCGVMAKELATKMESKHPLGLVSHIGGHKFAGNVIMYKQVEDMTHSYWFRHMNPLVVDCVLEEARRGNLVSEFYRGSISFK